MDHEPDAASSTPEWLVDLPDFVEQQLRTGYLTPQEVVETAVECFADDASEEELRPEASRLTEQFRQVIASEQANWPTPTDCERLDQAFEDLERRGILAKHNYLCCQACGIDAIVDDMKSALASGRAILGYTFYHEQDTERAAEGGGLYLAFGSKEHDPGQSAEVAKTVVHALTTHGLRHTWDGTLKQRIYVHMSWMRPVPIATSVRRSSGCHGAMPVNSASVIPTTPWWKRLFGIR